MPLTVALVSALLVGCTAAAPAPTPEPTIPPRPAAPASIGADLLGTWTITDVETANVGTIEFTPGAFVAQLACGEISGSWMTAGDAWLGVGSMTDGGCVSSGRLTAAWLAPTVGIVRVGQTWSLVDSEGATTATLTDGISSRGPTVIPVEHRYSAIPLDPALSVGPIEGRWLVAEADDSANYLDSAQEIPVPASVSTYLELVGSTWRISTDGNPPCGRTGRFVELGNGYVLSGSPGITASIGCPGLNLAPLITDMRTAGFDGEELVLFDAEGEEIVRLISAMEGWTPCEHEKRNGGPQWRDGCDDR